MTKYTKTPRTQKRKAPRSPRPSDVIRPEDEIILPVDEMSDRLRSKLYLAAEKALQLVAIPPEQPADIGKPLYVIDLFAPVLGGGDARPSVLSDFPTAVFVPRTKRWKSCSMETLARRGRFVPLSQLSDTALDRLRGWPVRRCTWTQSDLMLSRALYRIEVLEQRLERYSSDLDDLDTKVRSRCGCCYRGCS
jgi:hypothetical protein